MVRSVQKDFRAKAVARRHNQGHSKERQLNATGGYGVGEGDRCYIVYLWRGEWEIRYFMYILIDEGGRSGDEPESPKRIKT